MISPKPLLVLGVLFALLSPARAESVLRLNGEEVTVDKLADQFREVVFKTEDGQSKKLVRWNGPITVRANGQGSVQYRADLERHLKVLENRTRLPIRMASDSEASNLQVHFLTTPEIKKKFGTGFNCAGRFEGAGGVITSANVYLPNDNDRTKHCIAEEITQVLGLPNDTKIFRNSLFNDDTPPTVVNLTIVDSMVLATLYDRRLRLNTTEAESMPMARQILGEQLENVIKQIKERQAAASGGTSDSYRPLPMQPGTSASASASASASRPPSASSPQTPTPPQSAGPPPRRGTSSGTGIVVATDGAIVTNAHVVNGCSNVRVVADGKTIRADVAGLDRTNDLALLRADGRFQKVAEFAPEAPELGSRVVTYGFPLSGVLAQQGNFSLGHVTGLAGLGNDSRYLQISTPVQQGNSGGPLVDSKGQLVGVVTSKLNALSVARVTGDIPQNVNFAVRAQALRQFLDANSIKVGSSRAQQERSDVELAALSKSIAVFVQCE